MSTGASVRARAPCRVDLAGGTLDIWPLGLFYPGARTVNVAVDLGVEVTLSPRDRTYRVRQGNGLAEGRTAAELICQPEGALVGVIAEALELPPVEVRIRSASPRGGGLGASSAMAVALIAAAERLMNREASDLGALARLARDLEARLMRLPTGTQDHHAALLGGALEIIHRPGGGTVRRLEVDLKGLSENLLVVFSGRSHFSAASNWQIVRRLLDGEAEPRALFGGIAEVAAAVPAALEASDWPAVGELVQREWSYRRHLDDGISTPSLDSLLGLATSLGAWGAKACGAGGGGSIALLAPPERRRAIESSMKAAGGTVLSAAPTDQRLTVEG